ncbi:hypothetical protein [Chryseobacterium pennipullorum]|uniref:Glycosyltransferase RgtA/B/C/D-like domain-containing protein n=1 Tax=Chryseobacterium pennipullorum TaxID=2258963 RepID=A0A3D9B3L9_9FLAO|nr:hypothetical protein [Chryseobacterium pennipullorum]REC48240.1 hypothetical protein DRF67_07850 [Chryseobacterium pennipullorum]
MKIKWRISFLLVVLILVLLTVRNYQNRVYDWDMPGYLGCLYTSEFPDSPDKVRQITYISIQKEAPDDQYQDLIGTAPFNIPRQYFAKNTQAFTEQLPYFRIKVGYICMISLLYKLGVTSPLSVLLVSLISYFFSGLLVFYILKILYPEKYIMTAFLTVGIMLFPLMTYIARIPAPEMFIFPFLLTFIIGLIRKWSTLTMFLLLLVITFIRPDYATFTLSYLVTIFLFTYYKEETVYISFIVQGAVIFILYISIINFYDYPGWKNLFFDSFIKRRPIISAEPPEFGISDYVSILYHKAIYFKKITFAALLFIAVVFWKSKDLWVRVFSVFFFANVYIKFLFFPQSAEIRFFFPLIFLLFLMMMYAISQKHNNFKLTNIS